MLGARIFIDFCEKIDATRSNFSEKVDDPHSKSLPPSNPAPLYNQNIDHTYVYSLENYEQR